jgi:hypothetical protein
MAADYRLSLSGVIHQHVAKGFDNQMTTFTHLAIDCRVQRTVFAEPNY